MRRLARTVPAPAGLGLGVIGAPIGSDVDLNLRLESVMEGVLVSGTARARVTGECVRCLEPVEGDLVADLQELYRYPGAEVDDEDELPQLEGDLIDLEPVLRDAVVLSLPLRPLCQQDCLGLCPECGSRLGEDPTHTHAVTDPRWAALYQLVESDAGRIDEKEG